MLKRMLTARGVLFMVTRFGGQRLRRLAFDQKYESGEWGFLQSAVNPGAVSLVNRYGKGHSVLVVGCGQGALIAELWPDDFRSVTAFDVSASAIEYARQRCHPNMVFEVNDMENFESTGKFDLILFEESLYYVNAFRRRTVLQRYTKMLSPNGVIIVTIAHPDRFRRTID